jgi:uncharacterized metal-binding protein YceD (DUF177 family)
MIVMTKSAAPPAEFSRPVAADQIGTQETEREIVANEIERARLAERFGLLALDRLAATLQLKRSRSGVIRVTGRFEAEVVQACVVTLEPVPARVSESFAVAFGPSTVAPAGEVVIVDLDEDDPAEELVDDRIDLGEVVAQQLAVALDPYPRAPGVDDRFRAADGDGADGGAEPSPFAALERLRERRN